MPARSLQERIETSLYARRKKHWHQRWWGRFLIVILLFIGIFSVIFAVRVSQVYRDVTSGKATASEFLEFFKQDARIDLLERGDDPNLGPRDAKVTIVAFEDFECPFCFQAQPFIKRMLAKYPNDVRFVYKDFPLNSIHPRAQGAAEAGQCAFEQGKFWQFHDELFAHQDRLADAFYRTVAKDIGLNLTVFNECYATGKHKKRVAEDVELGRTLGLIGTPTFFINGELFSQGYSPEVDQAFYKAIEYIRSL